ncbi:RagB/SusD family nutrient uptake outer membrane protein [Bacteroides congonensis]|uniref:RagB/SusD family nutrient uptake outer membrane protein n=1 Tax=Bacteroides congonensis TaxID=1871006 RepID=UPI0026757EFE|nr:RagB/SusD family nutrient uptake outer membrane protein [Bacteroides congonensis]
MKKILGYLPILLLLFGCEDFLNREAYNQIDSNHYYTNETELNTAVLACYNGIHKTLDREFFVTEWRSDNTRCDRVPQAGDELALGNLDTFSVLTDNIFSNAYWEAAYHNIANCNVVLQYLGNVDNPEKRIQFEAEARFIRAYHYFNLVRLYGPLFIVSERISHEVAKLYERSSVEDVYQFIIDDLKFGADNLTEKYDDADLGRVDQWGAKTLLAKVYLTLSQNGRNKEILTEAKTLLEDVKDHSGYGLLTDKGSKSSAYANLFNIDNELNKEMIFVSRYLSGGKGIGSPFGNYFAPRGSEGNVIYGGVSGYNQPTKDLIAAYTAGDTRKDVSLKESFINKLGNEEKTPYVCKYTNPVTVRYDGESDWPILRFADVLLMLGEIENELNGPTDVAKGYLKQIRTRAGVPTGDVDVVMYKNEYRDLMAKERRLEFAFENHRFFDLQRTDKLMDVMKEHFQTEDSKFYQREQYVTIYVDVTKLQPWKFVLPIPYNVMITTTNASQNAGY